MADLYVAKRITKVSVGNPTGNRVARVLFAGDPVPEGVAEEQLKRLVERGHIAKVESASEVSLPEGDPADSWTVPQLKLYAEQNSIDIAGAKNKPEVLAAIAAAKGNPPAGE